jgi:hypothetical protein
VSASWRARCAQRRAQAESAWRSRSAERQDFRDRAVPQRVLNCGSPIRRGSTTLKPNIKPLCDGLVRKGEKRSRINGGRTRTRTWDPLIKSQLLYQLSYAPGISPPPAVRAGSCSKAGSHCPGKARNAPSCRRISIAWRAAPFSGLPPAARVQFGAVAAHIAAVRPFHSRAPEFHKRKAAGWGPGGSRTSAIVSGGWECDR